MKAHAGLDVDARTALAEFIRDHEVPATAARKLEELIGDRGGQARARE